MNGVVIYKSKYGATLQYAKWIGKELDIPVFEAGEISMTKISSFDFVILGSSVYIGKLLIKQWLKMNLDALWHRKIFLFVVSGTPVDQKDKLDAYVTASVPEEARNLCDIYFFPGKMRIKRLSLFDRFLIHSSAWLAKRTGKMHGMPMDYNGVKKENIGPLVNKVKNFSVVSLRRLNQEPAAK